MHSSHHARASAATGVPGALCWQRVTRQRRRAPYRTHLLVTTQGKQPLPLGPAPLIPSSFSNHMPCAGPPSQPALPSAASLVQPSTPSGRAHGPQLPRIPSPTLPPAAGRPRWLHGCGRTGPGAIPLPLPSTRPTAKPRAACRR